MDLVSYAQPCWEDLRDSGTLSNASSPYTKTPVPIQFGAEEIAYLVPPHFLPPEWLDAGVPERFEFPDIDTHTGHTIVHYLYKGSYETPPASNSVIPHKHNGLRAALLVFIATSSHGLHDLQQLATREIEKHGSTLSLIELLETIDDNFPRLDSHGWVHEYLRRKAEEAFDRDHTVFSDKAFLQDLESAGLIKFMAKCVVDLYSTKIAGMMHTEQSVSRPESPRDRKEQHMSQIEDKPNIARAASRISSVASEVSVEQSCGPRTEAVTLSDSFSTLSCSLPEATPLDTNFSPDPTAEDVYEIQERMTASATSEACEIVEESWPNTEKATEPEPVMSDSPCSVEEIADESVAMPQEWPAVSSEAWTEDVPEATFHAEDQRATSPCHRQAQHVLMGTGWKRCAGCLNVVRRLAGQVS